MHSHRPRHRSPPAPALPAAAVPAEPPDPATSRALRLGGIAIIAWYLGGFVLLLAGLMAGVGPVAWTQGWMSRSLGWDSPVVAFLPPFALLALPVVVLRLVPLQTGNAFIRGAQLAFAPTRDPATRLRHLSDAETATKLGSMARAFIAIGLLALVGSMVAFLLVAPRPAHAGEPLPRVSVAQLVSGTGTPPSVVRLTGLSDATRPVWVRRWSIRQTAYEDVYLPLDVPAAGPDGHARLLGLASYVLGDDDEPRGEHLVLATPLEGMVKRTSLPAWQRAAMATRGIVVDDPVLLFRQDRMLGGRYPGRDWIGGLAALIPGGAGAVVFLGLGLSLMVKQRRLLAQDR